MSTICSFCLGCLFSVFRGSHSGKPTATTWGSSWRGPMCSEATGEPGSSLPLLHPKCLWPWPTPGRQLCETVWEPASLRQLTTDCEKVNVCCSSPQVWDDDFNTVTRQLICQVKELSRALTKRNKDLLKGLKQQGASNVFLFPVLALVKLSQKVWKNNLELSTKYLDK